MVKLFGFLLGGSFTVALIVVIILNLGSTSSPIDKLITKFEDGQTMISSQVSQMINETDFQSASMEKYTENAELKNYQFFEPDEDPLTEIGDTDVISLVEPSLLASSEMNQSNEWQGFWVFSNQYSAEHFAKHLGSMTNLEIKAFPTAHKDFVIAFAYTSEIERVRAQQYLEAKGSIKLNRSVPEFVSFQ